MRSRRHDETDEESRLGTWGPNERKQLAARLRSCVKAAGVYEQPLWNELLRCLEAEKYGGFLTTDQAADAMGIAHKDKNEKQILVSGAANRLRAKIEDLGERLSPNPGVYLSEQTYAIQVRQPAPKEWKRNSGPSIGLLLADAADWFVGDLIRGVTEVCNNRGYDLLVEISNGDSRTEAKKLQHVLERADGALIVPVAETSPDSRLLLRERDCVLLDRYLVDCEDVSCVHHDDVSAGRQAALYLKEFRCARVLIVDQGSRLEDKFAITPLADRVRGCKLQLEGDSVRLRCLRVMGCDEQGGFDALEFFEKKEPILPTDGIFALTDKLALGCRHYLNTRNPRLDLPLIGAEGQAFGDFLEPPLTSIHFDVVEMARQAATVLINKLQKAELPPTSGHPHFLIAPTLLKASPLSGKRESIPITFADASTHYSPTKIR